MFYAGQLSIRKALAVPYEVISLTCILNHRLHASRLLYPNANCQKNELASHTAHCSYGLPTRRNVEASALQRLIFFTKCILSVADLLIIQLA